MDSQAYAQSRITLRCQQCGHEWKGRSSIETARQCSKCRSRQIVEVNDDDRAAPDAVIMVPNEQVSQMAAVPNGLMDDPEIRQKMRELQIARLEKQIAEEKASINKSLAFNRLVGNYKYLLNYLAEKKVLSKEEFRVLAGECPWCSETTMEFDGTNQKWVCKTCGAVAE